MAKARTGPSGLAGLAGLLEHVEGRGIQPAYLLLGEDRRDIDAAIAELEDRLVDPGMRVFDSTRLRGLESSWEDVVLAGSTLPMASPRRFVLVREPERLKGEVAPFLEYMERPAATACLVLVPVMHDRRISWAQKLEAGSTIVLFEPPSRRDAESWIRKALQARGLAVEPAALVLLKDLVEAETLLLANEVDKLALCCAGRKAVTAEDVEAVLGRTRAIDSFVLTNAIEDGDPQAALAALRRLLDQGAEVPMLVGTLDWCLGRLLGSEEPRTFPNRVDALARRRQALQGHALELLTLLREADRMVRTTGANAEAALERAVLAAAGAPRRPAGLNLLATPGVR